MARIMDDNAWFLHPGQGKGEQDIKVSRPSKSLKFIEASLQCEEDGNEEFVGATYMRHQFDAEGLWDTQEKDRMMVGAMEAASAR